MSAGRSGRIASALLFGLLASQGCAVLSLVAWYRLNYKPSLLAFLLSPPGWVSVAVSLCFLACAVWMLREWRRTPSATRWRTVALNLILLMGTVGTSEALLRQLAVRDVGGEHIGTLLIRPRGWEAVVSRYRAMIQKFEQQQTFYVGDPELGWILGSERRSEDGLSFTSREGIRSPAPGVSYDRGKQGCRIAIVGDSFAFGDEVLYQDSWGAFLEAQLGHRCQILNFAVGGYSIGQMYLRFERDVLPWNPDLVIVGFTDGALARTMGVYGFLVMTDWECPWAQPRFGLEGGKLTVMNAPLPSSREIFASPTIRDLPHIMTDRWYLPSEWEQPNWAFAYWSQIFRWTTSIYPLHDTDRAAVSDESLETVNGALFGAFVERAGAAKIPTVLLYLPVQEDYAQPRPRVFSHPLLERLGVPWVDATPCLQRVPDSKRFVPTGDHHFSRTGSEAVATCVRPSIERLLHQASPH